MQRFEEDRERYERLRLSQQRILAVLFSLLMLWALLSIWILTRFVTQASLASLNSKWKLKNQYMNETVHYSVRRAPSVVDASDLEWLETDDTLPLDRLIIENRRIPPGWAWNYPFSGQTQRYFADPDRLQDLVELGPHFLTTQSGCRIARWYYPTPHRKRQYRDCSGQATTDPQKRLSLQSLSQIQDGDTIYVTFIQLEEFVTKLLDKLSVQVVILSGQIQQVPAADISIVERLLNHPRVLHCFCQNLPLYGGANLNHPKLSPMPYGLKEVVQRPDFLNQPLVAFRKLFLQTLERQDSTPLLAALMRQQDRTKPQPQRLPPDEYLAEVARSQYILSPNGDRPECFRHYEAIGLGTIAITELGPWLFRHLKEAPIVVQTSTSDWNVPRLQHKLPTATTTTTTTDTSMVNRNMIMEEYWMEYMDWTVGRLLTWWNVEAHQPLRVPELFDAEHVV